MTNVVTKDVQDVKKFAREIVLQRVIIIAAIAAVLQVAVSYGWITPDISAEATTWVNHIIDLVALAIGTLAVRQGVTPANPDLNPTSSNGLPLIEQGANSVSSYTPPAPGTAMPEVSQDTPPTSDYSAGSTVAGVLPLDAPVIAAPPVEDVVAPTEPDASK